MSDAGFEWDQSEDDSESANAAEMVIPREISSNKAPKNILKKKRKRAIAFTPEDHQIAIENHKDELKITLSSFVRYFSLNKNSNDVN